MKRWTDDENALFTKLWHEGVTIPKMAPHFPDRSVGSLKLRPAELRLPKRGLPKKWSDEDITYLCENTGVLPQREMAKHLKRSVMSVQAKIVDLGIKTNKPVRFSDDDDAYIKKAYVTDLLPVEEIAAHVKHSAGTTRQHILKLRLRRDARRQRLINRFGEIGRDMTKSPSQIRAELRAADEAEKEAAKQAHQDARARAIISMENALAAGTNRRFAFQQAMLEGATLNDIGVSQGITRERVRQVVHGIRPAYVPVPPHERKERHFVSVARPCVSCGDDYMPTYYNSKYCDKCRPVIAKSNVRRAHTRVKLERLRERLLKLNERQLEYVLQGLIGKQGDPASTGRGITPCQGDQGGDTQSPSQCGGPAKDPSTGGEPVN